ncbi:two-component system response regulator [Marinomonas sp.]
MFFSNSNSTDHEILIVDDTPQHALELMDLISEYGQVLFSESAEDAFKLLERSLPDLILLDIDMPDMDGLQMCRVMKRDPRYRDIPVIFITGHDEPELELFSLEVGGLDFIQKPFNPKVSKLRVKNQLQLREQQRLIAQSKDQLKALVEQVPAHITYWDENWHNLYSNGYFPAWGASVSPSLHIDNLLPEELNKQIKFRGQSKVDQSYTVHLEINDVEYFYQVFQSHNVDPQYTNSHLITIIDVTEENQAKRSLFLEKERLRVTLNSIGDGVIATDNNGLVTFMNSVAERMVGWRLREARGLKVERVMKLQDSNTKQELRNPLYLALKEHRTVSLVLNSEVVSKSGNCLAIEDSAAPIRNEKGEIIGGIMVFHDVSNALALANRMSHVASHDSLTDLPNRISLQEGLVMACQPLNDDIPKVAVLLIDIDHFKYLNDSLGHQYGDELICLMAQRLTGLMPEKCSLARVGGDEFVVLMRDVEAIADIKSLASSLLLSMHEQFKLADQFYSISISMGISIYPDDATDSEQLMRHADVAMYRAKQEGRNRYSFFSNELEEALLHRNHLEKQLRDALSNNQLGVYFQAKFCLGTNQVIGVEALARMFDEEGSVIPPNQFIGLAEETGLILELGNQVLDKACKAAKQWFDLGYAIPISVNVAAAQFNGNDLAKNVESILLKYQLPPNLLELEITETSLMENVDNTQTKLVKLKRVGVNIAIDDFGTGYSSLAYLKKFDIDVMKIDMSFVADMLENKHDYEIVKTIISLGLSMDLELIAEGVEEDAQRLALLELGCKAGQGYLFSKPVPLKDFMNLLSKS